MNEHEVIRDLIPSYLDGITSPASNQLIEEHIKNCPECRNYLDQMRQNIQTSETAENQHIDAFKKVRKVNRRKIALAIIGTLTICLIIAAGYAYYFGHSWLAEASQVEQKYSNVNNVADLTYKSKNSKTILNARFPGDKTDYCEIYETRINPLSKPSQRNAHIGYTFVDEDTINDRGKIRHLTDKDVLTIKFKGEEKKIKIKDLYDGQNLQ